MLDPLRAAPGQQLLPAPVGPGSAALPWCLPLGVAGQLLGRPAFPVRAYTQSSLTQECHLATALTDPRTRGGHAAASGWRLSCTGVSCAASPVTGERGRPGRAGEEAMSYQRPPDYQAGAAGTTNPPGWYLDPIGLQSLRWWDGAQWARDTQPLLGPAWERPSPYPDAIASVDRYGAFGQPGAGRHRQQDGRQGGMGYAPGLAPQSFPPVRMQAQPDPGQPQDPQGSPGQRSRGPGPPSPAHHASRQRRSHKARGALSGLGALIGSSSLSARRTRTARHRQEAELPRA